ncbi:hypothetical protein [Marinobacter sp. ANT_B65]|uniref:hypothetical protein n=1 Tax=Marinobacter sp. ANT_B65 TaxID=2039467 RepID=UPI000BBE1D15|nr:hypothetical protein [Marinobacter sp. ANT_B65]PCM43772.1 hypothetical protein CPA50_15570 [Marinobacter sp. ANT_B65]
MNKSNKSQSLSNDLALTIAKSGGVELPAELLEFTIDQVVDESILKDIPVVGWLAKGFSVTRSISDRIFHHKVLRFLIELEEVSKSERQAFLARVESDTGYRRKVGEHLLVILNKIDAFEKTSLLAKCFDHFLTGDINFEYFVDLSNIIERTPLSDLNALCVPSNQRIEFSSVGIAVACGILEFGIASTNFGEDQPELGTKMSKYGKDLRDIFLGHLRERLANEKAQREALFGEEK